MVTTTPIRTKQRKTSRSRLISRVRTEAGANHLKTVQDLMDAIRRTEPEGSHLHKMLNSTVAHTVLTLNLSAEKLEINKLLEVKPQLKAYLKSKGFKRNSIRSYTNYLRILLQKAAKLGWIPCAPQTFVAWREISAAVAKSGGGSAVVHYAIKNGKSPTDFTENDLHLFGDAAIRDGRTYKWVTQVQRYFRQSVFKAGLDSRVPHLRPPQTSRVYGVPLLRFPDGLREEVLDLLSWKTNEMSPQRPYSARHRAVTAENLKKLISRVFGFVVKVQGNGVGHLSDLFSRQTLSEFANWAINHRKVSGRCVALWLGTIRALRIYPPLKGADFDWVPDLVAQLPRDSEFKAQERKEVRWVAYDRLAEIPDRIREAYRKSVESDAESEALMLRDILLIRWLVTLPWRQRNIRECKLRAFADGGNLFKEQIPPNSTIARPAWVSEALRANPQERFWQFRFRPQETKNGKSVHAVLPRQLIEPLETYVNRARSTLVVTDHHYRLFVNDHGRPFDPTRLEILVENLTLSYVNRRVNPHLFRDIFAVKWLEDHPEDYLTLSKVLWHSNIQTTLRIYGHNFDESHGARRVEEWLELREITRKRP